MREIKLPPEMLSGPFLFAALAVGICFIVIATTRFKMHPFIALIVTAYGIGLSGGLSAEETITALTGGFGKTIGYIGIVIACGCIIGMVLERSGCALVMANFMVRIIGKTRSVLAMSGTGAIVSIPVFCDSGYVILSPLIKSLARKTKESLATYAVALSMGLYATHCLVPPTPGPIAAAGELRADIGTVIMLGIIVVIPVIAATYAYARFIGKRIYIDPGELPVVAEENESDNEQAAAVPTPGAFAAFAPILFPMLLIALKSIGDSPSQPFGNGDLRTFFSMMGNPNTALILGVFLAWFIVRKHGLDAFGSWCGDGLRDAGTIILITAAGGALGGVLRATPMSDLVASTLSSLDLGTMSILLPFIVAVGLKTSIGSSTVAIITTASLISPLLPSIGLSTGYGPALATLAIASGSMMFSHVNDSYFWVITQMSNMTVSQGYRLVTVASAIAGLTAVTTVVLLSFLLL